MKMGNPHSVSACLILKNEAATIQKVLESVAWCDQIICGIDNLSNDDTENICRNFGADVYKFDFNSDFGGSRNQGFARVKTEWIIQPDGHEVVCIPSGDAFRYPTRKDWETLMANTAESFDVISPQLWNGIDDNGIPGSIFFPPRIYRSKFKMMGKTHNYLDGGESRRTVALPQWVMIHSRPKELEKERHEQRKGMNIDNLLADIEKNPTEARPYFYLAQTYNEMGEKDKAIEMYKKHISICTFQSEVYQSAVMCGHLLLNKGEIQEGIKTLAICEGLEVNRNDHTVIMGDAYMYLYDNSHGKDKAKLTMAKAMYQKAATYCAANLAALPMSVPITPHFIDGKNLTWYPWGKLARVYDQLGDYEKSLECAEKQAVFLPRDNRLKLNILNLRKACMERKLMGINRELGI